MEAAGIRPLSLFSCNPMETSPTQRRPFQFGIRKLLLWTAVWSAYLGIVRWVGNVAFYRTALNRMSGRSPFCPCLMSVDTITSIEKSRCCIAFITALS